MDTLDNRSPANVDIYGPVQTNGADIPEDDPKSKFREPKKISLEERWWYFSIAASTAHSCGMQIHRQRRFRRKVFHIFHPSWCGHRFSLFLLSNFPPMPWWRSRVAPNGTKSCSLCVEEDKSIQSNSGRNLLWNISLPAASFVEVLLPAMVTPNSSEMVHATRKSITITFRYCLPPLQDSKYL